ncbi:hypothetical protein ABE37_00005, partial [Cytobacillus firmus]|nr:hypothetical protein [Cytobacillus firmus]
LHRDAQAGVAVIHNFNVFPAAQPHHDGLAQPVVIAFGLVLLLAVQTRLLIVILTAGRLHVEAQDQEAEHHKIEGEHDQPDQEVHRPVGLLRTERQVVKDEVDNPVGADGVNAQQREQYHADAGQHRVHHEEQRGDKQEGE